MAEKDKSLESWIWDAACSIRGAADAPKYKDFILPLVFAKRLCDVFDDEISRIAEEVGSRGKAFKLVAKDNKLVRFYLPFVPEDPDKPVWSVVRNPLGKGKKKQGEQDEPSGGLGQELTSCLREIAKHNPLLEGIIDRVDFNATTHAVRDIEDDRLSNLIEKISEKRLGLTDVEPDIIGRSYEYLIRKFAEGSGQSAGEFYTPKEVGIIMARVMDAEPGMEVYDPCCGSAGLLVKCELAMEEKMSLRSKRKYAPLKLFGQEYIAGTWAMANMNMIIHDMEGEIEIGDTFHNPKFRAKGKLRTFDRVVANPMWNQDWFGESDYDADELGRFPPGAGYPGSKADWGWIQHIYASLKSNGRAAIVMGAGSASRGSEETRNSQERNVRQYFVDNDAIEAVILLPFNLFYNTDAPGLIYVLNRSKPRQRASKVLFINASLGYTRGKPKNLVAADWIDKIGAIYHSFEEREGISAVVDISTIQDKDYHLRPSRYVFPRHVPDAEPTENTLASYVTAAASGELQCANLDCACRDLEVPSKEVVTSEFGPVSATCLLRPLAEYIEEYTARAGATDYPVLSCSKLHGIVLQEEKFGHTHVASANQENYKIVEPGMFAFDPMLLWDGSIGLNRYDYAGVVSPAYTVFHLTSAELDPEYLEYVVRSKVMIPFYISISDGTNMRRRKAKFRDLAALRIPILEEPQRAVITAASKLDRSLREMSRCGRDLAGSVFRDSMFGARYR